MNYKHITNDERVIIDHLFNNEKLSISEIARRIGRDKSSISREIKRNTVDGYYCFSAANDNAKERQWNKHMFYLEKHERFQELFLENFDKRYHGVKATWNKIVTEHPEIDAVSWRQVYNWISSRRWKLKPKDRLRIRRKNGNRKRKDGMFSKFKDKYVFPIWMRPKHIDLREEFGHYEIDYVIGKKEKGFENLITITERKTRYGFIEKIKTKNPMKCNSAIYKAFKCRGIVPKSITIDNGIEFEKIGLVGHWLKCPIYFCDPYASYQRGSNENFNGLIRRTYKKGTNFSEITENDIIKLQLKINTMPREIFNWRSSAELFEIEINK